VREGGAGGSNCGINSEAVSPAGRVTIVSCACEGECVAVLDL